MPARNRAVAADRREAARVGLLAVRVADQRAAARLVALVADPWAARLVDPRSSGSPFVPLAARYPRPAPSARSRVDVRPE